MAVDLTTWLTTFQNQRHLAHTASILFSGLLFLTGFANFVLTGTRGTDFKDFDGDTRRVMLTWMAGVVGMLSTAANAALYGRIVRLDKFDPLATEESMSIKRTTTCVIGALGLTIVAVAEFALAGAAGRDGFFWIPFVASFAACVTIVTIAYDVIYLVQPSQNRITLDESTTVRLEHDEFDP